MQDSIDRARRNNPERADQLDEIAEIRRKKTRAGWAVIAAMGLATTLFALSPVAAFVVLAGLSLVLFNYHSQLNKEIREISRADFDHIT